MTLKIIAIKMPNANGLKVNCEINAFVVLDLKATALNVSSGKSHVYS